MSVLSALLLSLSPSIYTGAEIDREINILSAPVYAEITLFRKPVPIRH